LINKRKTVEEKTIEAIRIRHRSYSTEKTYIAWLRQFQGFVKNKELKALDGKDLQDFLTQIMQFVFQTAPHINLMCGANVLG
jgi:hypothetical protein